MNIYRLFLFVSLFVVGILFQNFSQDIFFKSDVESSHQKSLVAVGAISERTLTPVFLNTTSSEKFCKNFETRAFVFSIKREFRSGDKVKLDLLSHESRKILKQVSGEISFLKSACGDQVVLAENEIALCVPKGELKDIYVDIGYTDQLGTVKKERIQIQGSCVEQPQKVVID